MNWILLGLVVALYLKWKGSTKAALQREQLLRTELDRVQVQADQLRHQLNPHFLFNAINTVRYFVRTEPAMARELLLDLSTVLQSALGSETEARLREEIEAARAYLRLEQARLGERLEVIERIDERGLDGIVEARVIGALLRGVVRELAARAQGGTILLTLEPGRLLIEADGAPAQLSHQVAGLTCGRGETTSYEWKLTP
ncbi:MAG: histidine kinase [Vulcanimicrobiota bacterium]